MNDPVQVDVSVSLKKHNPTHLILIGLKAQLTDRYIAPLIQIKECNGMKMDD